ncbi:MAG: RluA family pseudouridine synthase [Rubricella sp.]
MSPVVNPAPPPMPAYDPPDGPLRVVHRDDALIVVDKPAGLLTVPGRDPVLADCLEARVKAAFPEALLVHRLDMDTSGLVVFAASPAAQRHLGLQFERRRIRKTYHALVDGIVAADTGRIDLPLIADWPNRPLQKVCHETGRAAVTDWRVIGRGREKTLLELRPVTGRSHQLRVHCRETGHPIVGDRFYGGSVAERLMLIAHRLELRHPEGGRLIEFVSLSRLSLN